MIVKGYYSVRGGHLKSMVFGAIDRAETEVASADFKLRQPVDRLVKDWDSLTLAQRQARLVEELPDKRQRKMFTDALDRERKGFGKGESEFRRLQGLGAESRERALAIRNILNDVYVNGKDRYLFLEKLSHTSPPLLNDVVQKQLMEMLESREIISPQDAQTAPP